MKKERYVVISTVILIIATIIIIFSNTQNTLGERSNSFSVDDTAKISKIKLSDKSNHNVILTKNNTGYWTVNHKYNADSKNINSFLETLSLIQVKSPVSRTAKNKIIKSIEKEAVKVEIFVKKFRINIWSILLFPFEKLEKTYFVGETTEDKTASYMMIKDAEEPYIIHIPGIKETIGNRYSPIEEKWRDHTILSINMNNIKTVTLEFPKSPDESYTITNEGNYTFSLKSLKMNTIITDYDTLKLLKSLSEMQNIRYENILTNDSAIKKDSILQSTPFHILSITDINNNRTILKTFHKPAPPEQHEFIGTKNEYDLDRMYVAFNIEKELAIIQFFLFDNILRPLSFYYKLSD